ITITNNSNFYRLIHLNPTFSQFIIPYLIVSFLFKKFNSIHKFHQNCHTKKQTLIKGYKHAVICFEKAADSYFNHHEKGLITLHGQKSKGTGSTRKTRPT